jgi:hypothetical protein
MVNMVIQMFLRAHEYLVFVTLCKHVSYLISLLICAHLHHTTQNQLSCILVSKVSRKGLVNSKPSSVCATTLVN